MNINIRSLNLGFDGLQIAILRQKNNVHLPEAVAAWPPYSLFIGHYDGKVNKKKRGALAPLSQWPIGRVKMAYWQDQNGNLRIVEGSIRTIPLPSLGGRFVVSHWPQRLLWRDRDIHVPVSERAHWCPPSGDSISLIALYCRVVVMGAGCETTP